MLAVRWRIAVLLCLITTVNYLDRQALAVAAPSILATFGLDNTQFGLINSAFLACYGLGHLLAGPFIDRVGTKRAFSIAVVAWSLAGMLHAGARGFGSFLACRGLLGLAESANFPAAVKAIAEWFPARDRSLAIGILTVGPGLGAVIAPPLLGALIVAGGWQWAFLGPGLAGFVWLLVWQRAYHDPADHPTLPAGQRALVPPTVPGARTIGMTALLRYPEVRGLLLARVCNDGGFYFFVGWLPLYLAQARGFDLAGIAAFAWIPFLAADLGALAGGYAGRRLMANGTSLDRARKLVLWAGALLVLASLPAGRVGSASAAIALIGLALFAIQFKASSLFALPADLFPAASVGTVWGLFGAAGSLGAAAFSAGAGWLTTTVGYGPVFIAVAVTQLLSAACVSWSVPTVRVLVADERPA